MITQLVQKMKTLQQLVYHTVSDDLSVSLNSSTIDFDSTLDDQEATGVVSLTLLVE